MSKLLKKLEPAGGIKYLKPQPAGGIEYRKKELDKRLACSTFIENNYKKYLKYVNKWVSHCDYEPIKIEIENVSRCNYRCKMCQVSDWPKGKRAEDLSFGDFKNLIDSLPGLVEVKIQGMGEPTLGRSTYIKMIEYLRSKNIWVRTVTNASLLHKSDFFKKLIDSDVNEIQISVDGANKEVFEKIRDKSVFETVVANCKLINTYCEEKGIVRTKMWTVVQKDNVHQLHDLLDLAYEMKFKHVVFTLDITGFGNKDVYDRNLGLSVESLINDSLLDSLIKKGSDLGINVYLWSTSHKYNKKSICSESFSKPYVSSDMRVVPCCVIANPETYDLGSANNIKDIWNGDNLKTFRQSHIDGNIPYVCKGCYDDE